jgi:hypothetical protein
MYYFTLHTPQRDGLPAASIMPHLSGPTGKEVRHG